MAPEELTSEVSFFSSHARAHTHIYVHIHPDTPKATLQNKTRTKKKDELHNGLDLSSLDIVRTFTIVLC